MTKNRGLRVAGVLPKLFWTFACIGPSTFGGGYAILPIIEREIVRKRGWIDDRELADLVSIAGSAPGGVGVNAAAFVGYRTAGVIGAVAAVIGITLPTVLIVLGISLLYGALQDHPKVQTAFKGIQCAIVSFILLAAYKMAQKAILDWSTGIIASVTLFFLLFSGIHPIYLILAGTFAGIALVRVKIRMGIKVRTEKTEISAAHPSELVFPEYYI